MIFQKGILSDGQLSFERGEETHKSPSRVPRNQLCLLINGTTRQDYISPRPGWQKRGLTFASNADKLAFELGLFQGAVCYNPDVGPSHIVCSISGRLWKVTLQGVVSEITGYDGTNSTIQRQVWFCQAEQFLVWQDGLDGAIIYNGASAWRSRVDGSLGEIDGKPIKEVPTGACMEYAMGRLWVALPNGRAFVAGDLVGGPSGTPGEQFRDAVIRFSENEFLNEGCAFAVPASSGPIRAMRAVANLDTSLGQGPLQVFTTQSCFSVNAPYDRTTWKDVTYPIQTVSMLKDGALAQNSTINVNGDIWYRSHNGVRSFIIARRDFTQWGNRAMSHEVGKHIDDDQKDLLRYGSATVFDDRLLMTCAPMWSKSHGTYHKGLVALDFHPLTSINEPESPSWDGLWTAAHDIMQLVPVESEGVERCFCISLEPTGNDGIRRIGVQELTRDGAFDLDESRNETRIQITIESPRFDFENRLEQKILEGIDLWVSGVRGTVDFYVYYRPDEYPCWFQWKHWSVCAKKERCMTEGVNGCLTGLNLKPQYRTRMAALLPPSNCIEFTKQMSNVFYGVQYRLEIIGQAQLQSVRLAARRQAEVVFGTCLPTDAACEELVCCGEPDAPSPVTFPERWTRRSADEPGESIDATNLVLTTEDNLAIQAEEGSNFNPRG